MTRRSTRVARGARSLARLRGVAGGIALGLASIGCGDDTAAAGAESGGPPAVSPPPVWSWDLPPGFPTPIVPPDNPMTEAKVELGRHLFHDRRLSVDRTRSCASCHRPELAFTDGLPRARLPSGEEHPRGSPSLGNVAYAAWLGWANPTLVRLEAHVVVPLLGDDPPELGWSGREGELVARLEEVPAYRRLFAAAFPDDEDPIDLANLVRAIACFERTLIAGGSAVDRFLAGDQQALSPSARRGLDLFRSERLGCATCHAGWATTDAAIGVETPDPALTFHNTGLYDVDGSGAYPPGGTGLHAVTGRPEDMGKFRAPMLRNVAVTAPYMHDGSIATLDEVLDHYARGGRRIEEGPHAGDGRDSRFKSPLLRGFELAAGERSDLLAFLDALTDHAFLADPRFADPWLRDE